MQLALLGSIPGIDPQNVRFWTQLDALIELTSKLDAAGATRGGSPMHLTETESRQPTQHWSAEEEVSIAMIQQRDSVSRPEAVRRMQRGKKMSPLATALASLRRVIAIPVERPCQNPRCARGENGSPGSLAHLRADAMYCNGACKKAGQRSPKRKKRTLSSQRLCGPKGDKFGSLPRPP